MEIVEINFHSGKRISYYVCSTFFSLLAGDLEILQNLLNFGYTVKEYMMAIYNSNALYSFSSTPKFEFQCHDFISISSSPDMRCLTSNMMMGNQLENEDSLFSPHFYRRSVVHEVIIFLLKYSRTPERHVKSSMAKGFRLLWRSRRTPYVRRHEIHRILQEDWIYDECPKKCWVTLSMACSKYCVLFRDISEGLLSPRSLKQLSRCAVRDGLMKSGWSFGIEKLNIPKDLKSYLMLQS